MKFLLPILLLLSLIGCNSCATTKQLPAGPPAVEETEKLAVPPRTVTREFDDGTKLDLDLKKCIQDYTEMTQVCIYGNDEAKACVILIDLPSLPQWQVQPCPDLQPSHPGSAPTETL